MLVPARWPISIVFESVCQELTILRSFRARIFQLPLLVNEYVELKRRYLAIAIEEERRETITDGYVLPLSQQHIARR